MMRLIIRVFLRLRATMVARAQLLWEEGQKRRFGYCGSGVRLRGASTFVHPERMKVANNVQIGAHCWLQAGGGIEIGVNTIISRNCAIFSASHDYEGERLPFGSTDIEKPVCIGRNVWIGMNAMIIPGVTIGDGAIVGLGTVVVNDVPPLAIVGGYGHRIIGYRDRTHYEFLDRQDLPAREEEQDFDE